MRPVAATARVARRELVVEAAGREATSWVLPVAAAIILLVGLGAGPERPMLERMAPVAVWLVALLTAALLGVSTIRAERDEGCWDLLRALASPGVLLVGKALAVWLQLAVGWLLAAAAAVVMLHLPWSSLALAGGLVGTAGLAPVAVLIGVAVGDVTRRVGLALLLLLPLGLPPVLAGTQLAGHQEPRWLLLLTAYAVLSWTVAWLAFPMLTEE